MTPSLFTALVVIAAADAGPLKVAVTDLTGANLPAQTLAAFTEHVAGQLGGFDLSVVTSSEIAALIGVERQKDLLGCSGSGCMAELGNALGVDGVLVGNISHVEDVYQVELKIVDATAGSKLASFSARVASEKAVLETLDVGARALSIGMHDSRHRPMPAALLTQPSSGRAWALLPAGLTVALAVTGAVLLGLAAGDYATLTGPPHSLMLADAQLAASRGNTLRWAGVACFSVAGAALVAAGVVALFGGSSTQTVAIAPLSGGAALTWTGAFP